MKNRLSHTFSRQSQYNVAVSVFGGRRRRRCRLWKLPAPLAMIWPDNDSPTATKMTTTAMMSTICLMSAERRKHVSAHSAHNFAFNPYLHIQKERERDRFSSTNDSHFSRFAVAGKQCSGDISTSSRSIVNKKRTSSSSRSNQLLPSAKNGGAWTSDVDNAKDVNVDANGGQVAGVVVVAAAASSIDVNVVTAKTTKTTTETTTTTTTTITTTTMMMMKMLMWRCCPVAAGWSGGLVRLLLLLMTMQTIGVHASGGNIR